MPKNRGRVRIKQHGPKGAGGLNPMADLAIPPEEMIHLPPKQDSNTTHIYPMSETFTMDYKKFATIYPTYLDSTKSTGRGRRISASDAVPAPSVSEISEVLQKFAVRHVVQPFKGYPRDVESRWYNPGRVLVDMDDGLAIKLGIAFRFEGGGGGGSDSGSEDEIPVLDMEEGDERVTKKQLCREIARALPTMKSRIARLAEEKRVEEEERRKASEVAQRKKPSGRAGGASNKKQTKVGGGSKKKQKGKKK